MRWIVRLLSLVLMLVAVVIGGLFLLPTAEIARRAAEQLTTLTGRQVTIAEPVEIAFWPRIAVTTGPLTMANADWAGDQPMVAARQLRIAIDTAALLRGRVEISGLELLAPEMRLQRRADGRANWDLGAGDGAAAASDAGGTGLGAAVTLAQARLQSGRLLFDDALTGQHHTLDDLDATIRLPDLAGPAQVQLTGRLNGEALQLDLVLGPVAALLRGTTQTGQLAGQLGGARAECTGQLGLDPLHLDGQMTLEVKDRAAIGRALGLTLPDLPAGFGARSATASGKVLLTGDKLALNDLSLTLDDHHLRADLAVALAGVRPRLSGAITAETPLTLPESGNGGDGGPGTGSAGWSTAPIHLRGLQAVDADIAFAMPGLQVGGARIGATRGHLALDAGRAVITLAELGAYQGRITGTVVANARGNGSVRADLVVQDLAIAPLLQDLAGNDRLQATANGRVGILSSAASMAAMMTQMEGAGQLELGRGELRGLDIAGMLRHLDPGYVGDGQKTIFDSVSSTFTIGGGILRADDLRLIAPLVTVDGRGTVDLGQQTLDYRLSPVALAREDGTGGLKVPLLITGPWAQPHFRIDAKELARPKIEAERERAEQRLKDELARKAEDKLHISAEEGESLEDAAKRKLEREMQRGLGRLLRRN